MFSHIWEFKVRTKYFNGCRSEKKKKKKQSPGYAQRPGQCVARHPIEWEVPEVLYCFQNCGPHILKLGKAKTFMYPYRTPCKNTQEEIWQNSVTQTTQKVCHNLDVSGLAIYKAYYSHESHCSELSVSGRSLAYLKIIVRSEVKLWKPLHLVAVL